MVPLYLIISAAIKAKFPNTKNNTPHIKLSKPNKVLYIERSE